MLAKPSETTELVVNPDAFVRKQRKLPPIRWMPRGTFTLPVRMCYYCLAGQHAGCDHKRPCSCICREDLACQLVAQHIKTRDRMLATPDPI